MSIAEKALKSKHFFEKSQSFFLLVVRYVYLEKIPQYIDSNDSKEWNFMAFSIRTDLADESHSL